MFDIRKFFGTYFLNTLAKLCKKKNNPRRFSVWGAGYQTSLTIM